MTDLTGIAHQLHRSVENLRIAAGLLEQGYQPAFISQYRADETGNLPRAELWALKLDIDRQQRLANARARLTSQLPKDAQLDEEAVKAVNDCKTELDIETALRTFRARRSLAINQESNENASKVLEALIGCDTPVEDVEQFVAESLSVDRTEAPMLLEQTRRLIGNLLAGDTDLAQKLRESIQKKAKVSVELCPQPTSESGDTPEPAKADSESAKADSESAKADSESAKAVEGVPDADSQAEPIASGESASTEAQGDANAEPNATQATDGAVETPAPVAAETPQQPSSDSEVQTPVDATATPDSSTPADAAVTVESASEETSADATSEAASEDAVEDADAILSKRFGESKKNKKKTKAIEAAKAKPAAKLTPRQRRRRWLVAMLTPMKTLKKPLSKLTSYQQLMLGRGRRSQIVETHLDYDKKSLVPLSRDRFVRRDHPLAKWFSEAAEAAFDAGLRAKLENDAVAELEEVASEQLLTTAAEGLRRTLMQRPVRGHRIMVVDSVGPKVSAVAIVDQAGNVLACDEIQCSALATMVEQNVMRLGELAHKYKVTLLALTNGPARRFLVHTVRELVKQSANSGLRWTMADRSGADAYAAGRVALRELSAFNRRDRAAIWVARSLQDPLTQYLKVGINRIRLGSYQRELPQEPLKKLVRETIADCVASRGVDVHSASVAQLLCVPGIHDEQAQQIATIAAQGGIESRAQLLDSVDGWTETQSRQAVGLLRVFGSEQTFDATAIHPEDYRLAQRLVDNTEFESPPAAPEGWSKPDPMEVAEANSDFVIEEAKAAATAEDPSSDPATTQESAEGDSVAAEETSDTGATVAEGSADEASAAPAAQDPDSEASTADTPAEVASETVGEAAADTSTEAADSPSEGDSVQESVDEANGEADVAKQSESAVPAGPKPEYPEDVAANPPKPLPIDVEKLARGWQVGREKLKSIAHALNEPFADSRLRGAPVPLRTEMPSLQNLEPGSGIWAVVVGVADFGVFVELGPECSGLIHISRLSDRFVDDPHEFVQVGDLIMTWVVSVDEKKGRVALTALTPEQREAQRDAAGGRDAGRGQGQGGRGGQRSGGGNRGGDQRRGGQAGGQRGGQSSGQRGGHAGGQGGGNRGGGQAGGQRGDNRGRGGQRGPGRGGPRDGRGNRSRDSRPSKPVIVKSKKPVDPISSAMKDGAEPLRSFSDLLQFYDAKRTDEPDVKAETKQVTTETSEASPSPAPPESSPPASDHEGAGEAPQEATPAVQAESASSETPLAQPADEAKKDGGE